MVSYQHNQNTYQTLAPPPTLSLDTPLRHEALWPGLARQSLARVLC